MRTLNTMQNFQTDKTGGTFQKQMRGTWAGVAIMANGRRKRKTARRKSSSVFDLRVALFLFCNMRQMLL